VRAAGWDFAIVPAAVATWISVIIVGGMGIVVPSIAVNEVRAKLYPDVAGQRSAYYARAGHRGRILACIAGAVFLGVAALVAPELEPRGLLFTVGTALYFLFITASLMGMPGGKAASRAASGTLGSLVSAFGAAGYRCIERPKTDDPSLDPLIAAVDLLATSDRQAYAVKLEVLSRTDAVPDRDHALEVRIGAKALQKGMASGATPSVPVEPYLLVIGGTVPEDFWGFAGEVGVKLVHVPDAAALAPTGQDAADVALRVLQVPAATPGPRAARASSVGAP
jgi:hypothetical protein